ncbi:hypothetical protein SAMN04490201_0924 [Pseudomonas psychrophila]|uniref:Uncharacterized protein n=1 Tax=Pseudomonas psychrophila TaxID=122355 RepID=A0ABY0VI82_9PSED|nr:hypothetical protein SAMN04490201_0924 [Pseudomonas psychrophila]
MSGGPSSKDKKFRSRWRRNEAAFGGEAVVISGNAVCQLKRTCWFYDRFAIERSLVPSPDATKVWAWPAPAGPAVFSGRASAPVSDGSVRR